MLIFNLVVHGNSQKWGEATVWKGINQLAQETGRKAVTLSSVQNVVTVRIGHFCLHSAPLAPIVVFVLL